MLCGGSIYLFTFISEVSLATSISMGNESRSEGLGRSVSNTEMGYQQELMHLIALQTVKNAHRKEKQPKSMIVVGSGAIGVEFAHFYNAMGTDVTVVEFLPNVVPLEDEEISKQNNKKD